MATFTELYCQRYRVRTERYVRSMFWRCLHPRTWLLVPFLKLIAPDYFAADYDLIRNVGRLTHAGGLTEDLADFHTHPLNGSFARRRLRLRLSVRRVTKQVHRLLPGRAQAVFYDTAKSFEDLPATSAADEAPPHSASN